MKHIKTWLGLAISVLFLFLAFRKSDFHQILKESLKVDWWILGASCPAMVLHYGTRAWRWRYLLWPMGKPPFSRLFGALMIGLMANNLLPLRLGEFVRAYVMGRRENIPASSVFATIVVERMFDVFFLLSIFLLAALVLPLRMDPAEVIWVRAMAILGIVIMVGALAFVVLLKRKTDLVMKLMERALRRFPRARDKIVGLVLTFLQGLEVVGQKKLLGLAFVWSGATWFSSILFYWIMLAAFPGSNGGSLGLEVGLSGAAFVMGCVALGIMLPSSPGFVGTYQVAVIASLAALGASQPTAESVAIVSHALQFLSVTLMGILCLYIQNFSFKEIKDPGPVL